jgi:exopolysaccharide production protein ExoQ
MLKLIEKIFTVAMLFYTTGALLTLIVGGSAASTGSSPLPGNFLALVLQIAFYSAAFCFIAFGWRNFLHAAWSVKGIVVLSLLAVASTAWSQDPAFTLRRSLVLLASTAFGIYFGRRYTLTEQLRLLAWTCALVVVSSYAFGLFLPKYGVDHLAHPGDWQGVFIQKNSLARAMVFSALVFYFVRPAALARFRWLGLAGSICLLALSRSVTGIVVFALVIAILPLYGLIRNKLAVAVPVGIAVGLLLIVSVPLIGAYGQELLPMLHRSSTLTGRTDLWHAVLFSAAKRPWLGYGFNTFWMGMRGESASVMLQVDWFPKHSHNGFLDLVLDLGVVGLVTFLAGYLSLWSKALRLIRGVAGPNPAWVCTYLSFMFIYNLTESSILVQNNLFWILYVSTAATLCAHLPVKSFRYEAVNCNEFQTNNYCLQG